VAHEDDRAAPAPASAASPRSRPGPGIRRLAPQPAGGRLAASQRRSYAPDGVPGGAIEADEDRELPGIHLIRTVGTFFVKGFGVVKG
jgi:hypothetical protein